MYAPTTTEFAAFVGIDWADANTMSTCCRPAPTPPAAVLREFGASRLPKFKQPDAFHFAPELRLGRTGKADRGALRRLIVSGEMRPEAGPAAT